MQAFPAERNTCDDAMAYVSCRQRRLRIECRNYRRDAGLPKEEVLGQWRGLLAFRVGWPRPELVDGCVLGSSNRYC